MSKFKIGHNNNNLTTQPLNNLTMSGLKQMIIRPPIAVVGMAGVFPGASDIDIFWQNIINKVDTTCEVPKDRWIVEPESIYHPDPLPDKTYSKRACLIHDFKFNSSEINIDKDFLYSLDPLYHILLHVGRNAYFDCKTASLNKESTGIILAAISLPTDASSAINREILGRSFEKKLFGNFSSYKEKCNYEPITRKQCLSGRVTSLPSAILAEGLGLRGGNYTLDAACASSLYAVKLACDELYSYRSYVMLAGGVSRPESLYTQVGFSQLRALSPSGRCAPFDENADGLVVGEGAGMIVLKRLDDAIRDEDNIYGLIRGIGLSNDIGGSLLAPDSKGQVCAMRNAYKFANWSHSDIDLIECHGAGTPVGDAVELNSLRSLWGASKFSLEQCAIGSVKSMIGHLLTGAGAAGMIKTLLALKHKILPPSLNFQRAPKDSPLNHSPFRVQTEPEEWTRRESNTPLRAAVSAFGFGGINGHLLLEEWDSKKAYQPKPKIKSLKEEAVSHQQSAIDSSVAIIGMEAAFGSLKSLIDFQKAIFNGNSIIGKRPEYRWKKCENITNNYIDEKSLYGGFMEDLSVHAGEFRIPPNEIPDILPQHLLMLKISAKALYDAGLLNQKNRSRMSVIIGAGFDFEATNFHLRWNLSNLVHLWKKNFGLDINADEMSVWLESLKDSFCPPLTSSRTLGALGGIIASRIAKEFNFGGPSFVVSCEEVSGLKALEIGIRSLQQNETDAVLVGGVDLFGDVRAVIAANEIRPFSKNQEIRPFDKSADGTLPGEGAVAIVIKKLNCAIKDGDRIYAVIKGMGSSSGGGAANNSASKDAYILSLKRSFVDADISPSSISFLETHGSGNPLEDTIESEALNDFFSEQVDLKSNSCAIGSVKANIGHTGAVSGLASVVKTSLCLYQGITPPLKNFTSPGHDIWGKNIFHMPAFPHFWLRNRKDGPRRACTCSMTANGNYSHVILEEFEYSFSDRIETQVLKKVNQERKRPLGFKCFGLFVVEGNSKNELIEGLDNLYSHAKQYESAYKDIETAAHTWYSDNPLGPEKKYAISLTANDVLQLKKRVIEAKNRISSNTSKEITGQSGISYSPFPLGISDQKAFVFPGSGNHYIGMGREIGVQWPEILRKMDTETSQLKAQMLPHCYVPQRISWEPGWEKDTRKEIASDPLNMIFGQVVQGGVVASLVMNYNVKPSAVIGYSLGECTGLFAMGAWPDRGNMLTRMLDTDLFSTELAGPCNAARKAWNIPPDEDINWCVATLNFPAEKVQNVIDKIPLTRLLIINTPDECVIGGNKEQVISAIEMLGCEAIFIEGVVTVHCDAASPVADAYKRLHLFPATPLDGIRFYSCALGDSYELTSENAASSILAQAISGFDFTAAIEKAYKDGIRIFLEMGPYSSCTRMINKILGTRPHRAISVSARGEDEYASFLKFLGSLITERVPVNLDKLYGENSYNPAMIKPVMEKSGKRITLLIGGKAPRPALPVSEDRGQKTEDGGQRTDDGRRKTEGRGQRAEIRGQRSEARDQRAVDKGQPPALHEKTDILYSELPAAMKKNIEATSDAHKTFLDFSNELTKAYAKTLTFQNQLLKRGMKHTKVRAVKFDYAFSRDMCMEFAIGSVAKVLGTEFDIVDTYKVRVRLPDEPLMLVDRIISIEGEKGSLGSGRVVTEHDVLPEAWYLDGGRAPVCISVEAGQADLFLCSYLGIDHAVKGERAYRLLDAEVQFHRGLPLPGDVIRYEIEIEKFVHQGDTFLFFFSFEGFIGNDHLISMTNGCAGFFTEEEIKKSGGIIPGEDDTSHSKQISKDQTWKNLISVNTEKYDDEALNALRQGNVAKCFGSFFDGIELAESIRLPGNRMKLIDRILHLDPKGGKYGLGSVKAEADIHPDDWFLTCHFMDDMVMPGTLMYECCAHTLRVFLQRLGWVTEKYGVFYEPVKEVKSKLKCRGPVTPDTRHVVYEVEITKLGYNPEPYAIADAHMFADGRYIVLFKDMSLKMTGITRDEIETFWKKRVDRRLKTEIRDQRSEVRDQRSEIRGRTTDDGGQKTEIKGQRTEVRDQKSEVRDQRTEIRGQRTEVRDQKSEVRDQRTEIRGQRSEVRGRRSEDRGQRTKAPAIFDRDKLLAFALGKPSEAFGDLYKEFDKDRFIARLPGPPYLFIDKITRIEPEQWVLKPDGWIEAEYDVTSEAWYFFANRTSCMPFCVLLEIALQPCGWLAAYMGSALKSKKDLRFRNLGGNAILFREILQEAKTLTMRARLTQASEAAEMIIEQFDMQILQTGQMVYEGNLTFGFFSKESLAQQVGIHDAKQDAYSPSSQELQKAKSFQLKDTPPFSPDAADRQYMDSTSSLSMPAKAIRMIDIIDIYMPDGGPFGLGFIRGTKKVDPGEWFFKAHFYQDPVCPGSLGIESFLQLIKFMALNRWGHMADSHRFAFFLEKSHSWIYRGQITPKNKKIEVEAIVTDLHDMPIPYIVANGYLKVDGLYIYKMENFGIKLVPV